MRRRSKVDDGTEYYSVVRALRAVDDADIALLVIDATEGVTHQDQRLAERVDASGCPIVVLLNKWELLDTEGRLDVSRDVEDRLHFIGNSPVLRISAQSGKGVHKLLPLLQLAIEDYHRRVPTREVNKVIQAAQANQPAPGGAPGALRDAGRDGSADVHAVREPRAATDLPALPRGSAP